MTTIQLAAATHTADEVKNLELFLHCRAHVMARIEQVPVGQAPFHHLFIEDVFPDDFYDVLRQHMLTCKHTRSVEDRYQDNPAFVNQRFSFAGSTDEVIVVFRAVFSDPEVKRALASKFYVAPSDELIDLLEIHEGEFEYFFTKAQRFQNIHIDIPPKLMSFVFYIPEHPLSPEQESRNATVLYDKNLAPHYPAKFVANSVCVFAPHYYSYHGFASTIDRDVLVMFYLDRAELAEWQRMRRETNEEPPFIGVRDAVERKLRRHPLIEYGGGEDRLQAERDACRVNAPQGRIIV